jgi:hypothetical protein
MADIYDEIDEMDDDDDPDTCPGCGAGFDSEHDDDCPYLDDDEEDDAY